jgi:hypothetical protein
MAIWTPVSDGVSLTREGCDRGINLTPPPGGNLQGFFPHAGGRSLAKPCAVRVFVWLGPPYCAARNPGRGVRGYNVRRWFRRFYFKPRTTYAWDNVFVYT